MWGYYTEKVVGSAHIYQEKEGETYNLRQNRKRLLRRLGQGMLVSKPRSCGSQLRCNTRHTSRRRMKTLCIPSWNKLFIRWSLCRQVHSEPGCPWQQQPVHTEPGAAMAGTPQLPLGHHPSLLGPAPTPALARAPQQRMEHPTFLYKLSSLSTNPLFPLKPSKSFRDTSPSQVHTKAGAKEAPSTQFWFSA